MDPWKTAILLLRKGDVLLPTLTHPACKIRLDSIQHVTGEHLLAKDQNILLKNVPSSTSLPVMCWSLFRSRWNSQSSLK